MSTPRVRLADASDFGARLGDAVNAPHHVQHPAVFAAPEKPSAQLKPARFVRFGSIAVAAAQRGRGTGTALMQAVNDWARAANVFEFNGGAVRLYERLGCQTRSRNMALLLAP